MPSISLLTPTIGRSTLAELIAQFAVQSTPADEFIIVADGPRERAREQVAGALPMSNLYYDEVAGTGDWGSTPLDHAISLARGDYLAFIGDDDSLMPDAFAHIRNAVSTDDPHPYLFAMNYGGMIMSRSFALCSCSGQQFVVPNQPAKLARYAASRGETNDWDFMNTTVDLWNGRIETRDEVIAILHRRNSGRVF